MELQMTRVVISIVSFASALAFSTASSAQAPDQKKLRFCQELSMVYVSAAGMRDGMASPQIAYKTVKQGQMPIPDLTDTQVKKAINNVYFVPAFQAIPSEAMFQAVNTACLDNGPKYQPLQ